MRLHLEDEDVGLDLTPMIDCVFLLLIFFLVATTMKKPEEELKVELPFPAAAARPVVDRTPLVVGIDAGGNFYLSGRPAGQREVHDTLREIGSTDPERHIRITADRRAPSGALVQVLDLCAFEGLKNYGVHTASRFRDQP